MGSISQFFDPVATHPYINEVEVPPPPGLCRLMWALRKRRCKGAWSAKITKERIQWWCQRCLTYVGDSDCKGVAIWTPAKSLLKAMFTLYWVDLCTVSKVATVQCEQEICASLGLACSPAHTFKKWWQLGSWTWEAWENRLRWAAFESNLDPAVVASQIHQ